MMTSSNGVIKLERISWGFWGSTLNLNVLFCIVKPVAQGTRQVGGEVRITFEPLTPLIITNILKIIMNL